MPCARANRNDAIPPGFKLLEEQGLKTEIAKTGVQESGLCFEHTWGEVKFFLFKTTN